MKKIINNEKGQIFAVDAIIAITILFVVMGSMIPIVVHDSPDYTQPTMTRLSGAITNNLLYSEYEGSNNYSSENIQYSLPYRIIINEDDSYFDDVKEARIGNDDDVEGELDNLLNYYTKQYYPIFIEVKIYKEIGSNNPTSIYSYTTNDHPNYDLNQKTFKSSKKNTTPLLSNDKVSYFMEVILKYD